MSNSIDTMFTLAKALASQINLFHFISVPMHLTIVNTDLETPVPNTTNPNARQDEADATFDVQAGLNYHPGHLITVPGPGGRLIFVPVPASFSATLMGMENVSYHGTGGTFPAYVKITITNTKDPHANVFIGSSDSLAHFSISANRSMAPVQISPPVVNLPQNQPGYLHTDKVTVTMDFGNPEVLFRNPLIQLP